MKYIHIYDTRAEYNSASKQLYDMSLIRSEDNLVVFHKPTRDYSLEYFTIDILTSGKFTVLPARQTSSTAFTSSNALTISYSLNDAEWITTQLLDNGLTLDVYNGDKIRFKGNNTHYCANSGSSPHKQWYVIFGIIDRNISGIPSNNTAVQKGFTPTTALFNVYGNIMSLCYGDDFAGQITLPDSYTFCSLFKNSNVVSAEHLILPATTLLASCYRAMFSWAKFLTISPTLPNVTPVTECYKYMFELCICLKQITCLAPSGINTDAFDHWATNCPNTSDVLFIKNSNVTIGSSVGNTQYVINTKTSITEPNSILNGNVGSNWIVQNYVE